MEFTTTIANLLGRNHGALPPVTTHRWNHLLGVELELENVTTSTGGSIYDDMDFDPSDYDGDWNELSYEEQDEVREAWYSRNSSGCPIGWTLHSDASLRNGIEFVTSPPVAGQDMEDRLESFYSKALNYDGGPRTSTHIHIDVLNDNPVVLQSLVMLVYTIEDALYNIVDEGRKWAGYSMSLAEMTPSRLRNLLNPSIATQFTRAINVTQNRERYYGLNFNVARHGTVEFRYFPGAPSKQELTEWIDLVVLLKNTAITHTPEELMVVCNNPANLAAFFVRNLGYWGSRLVSNVGAEHLFHMFEEIAAIRSDGSNPERPSSIVKIQAPLYSVIINKLLSGSEEAGVYLTKAGIPSNIMSLEDAMYYMGSARVLVDNLSVKKAKKKIPEAEVEVASIERVVAAPSDWYTSNEFNSTGNLVDEYRRLIYPSAPTATSVNSTFGRRLAVRPYTSSLNDINAVYQAAASNPLDHEDPF